MVEEGQGKISKYKVKKSERRHFSDTQFALLLLAPACAVISFIVVFPLGQSIYYSFTNRSLLSPIIRWKGLGNYLQLLQNEVFWEVFSNTVLICFTSMGLQLTIGMGISLLLNQQIRGRNLFRGLFLTIWVIPFIVVTLLWMWLFNSDYGLINYLLKKAGIIDKFLPWLGLYRPAQVAVITTYTWRATPFAMIMLLAGLQTIPDDIIDAAKIDGAGALARFWYITLPHLKQIIVITSLLSVIRLFQRLIVPFIMTRGGPGYATTVLSLHVYKLAFQHFEMGQATAVGCLWLIFLFFVSAIYFAVFLRRKEMIT